MPVNQFLSDGIFQSCVGNDNAGGTVLSKFGLSDFDFKNK